MSPLAIIACSIGGLFVIGNLPAIFVPTVFRRAGEAFPRSRVPAWILTAVDLAWVSWVILHASLGRFEFLKPYVYAAAPISFLLIVFFMDELLAPRVLAGLVLLVVNPILNITRWNPSPWRLVITVIVYVWIVVSIVVILSPYRFRQLFAFITRTDLRTRVGGVGRLLFGIFLIFLGLKVY